MGTRTIVVYCDGYALGDGTTSHADAPERIGTLTETTSAQGIATWELDGPSVEKTFMTLPEYRSQYPSTTYVELLAAGVPLASRYRARCAACDTDVLLADRFSGPEILPGYGHMWTTEHGDEVNEMRRASAAYETARKLTLLADSGVSRLALTSLGRIITS